MNDLFPELKETPYLPIDFGLIYSGEPVLMEQIAGGQYKNNAHTTQEIIQECKNVFDEHLYDTEHSHKPKFYKYLIDTKQNEFELTYGKLMGIVSLKIFSAMKKMFCDGYNEHTTSQFLDIVKKMRQADCLTRDSSEAFLACIKSILTSFKDAYKAISLCPNDSSIMGGTLIFAMPLEGYRKNLADAMRHLEKDFPGAYLLYSSRTDSTEKDGLKIEQDISERVFSEFLNKNDCIIKRTNGNMIVSNCESSIHLQQEGLLLDTLQHKIYRNGQKLTSQDLCSQSATSEILYILIRNLGKEIANTELPDSGYSKNKNEMMGKIVIPLIEFLEKNPEKNYLFLAKEDYTTFT